MSTLSPRRARPIRVRLPRGPLRPERLFADYLTDIACRAAESGIALTEQHPLLVNVARPPLLAALCETTVREKVSALRRRGIRPAQWTPHWFRHTHATALQMSDVASDASLSGKRERFLAGA